MLVRPVSLTFFVIMGFGRRCFPGLAAFFFLLNCGTNTDQPPFPLYTYSIVAPPAIVSVSPVEVPVNLQLRMEFDINYYVTNQEVGFLGYNLYISKTTTSAEAALLGIGTLPYMPDGVEPTFPHVAASPSTASSALITQRVEFEVPPPGLKFFQLCEKYFFRMTAVTRNGLVSNSSPQQASCAALNPALCPTGTACNP